MRPCHAVFVLSWSFVLVLLVACSNQGQGEFCDKNAPNGGNDDCQSGLTCQVFSEVGRCCPVDLTQATAAACSANHPGVGTDAAPASVAPDGSAPEASTPEATTPEATTPDALADVASGDAPAEATADAAVEAPGDGDAESASDGTLRGDAPEGAAE
jgi:hypothetical protein